MSNQCQINGRSTWVNGLSVVSQCQINVKLIKINMKKCQVNVNVKSSQFKKNVKSMSNFSMSQL